MEGLRHILAGVILAALLAVSIAHAAAFSCVVRPSSSCNAGETLLLRLNSSEPGAGYNNSHAQLANYSGAAYPYSVCCSTDAFRTMTNTCGPDSTAVLNLKTATDSHVQAGTQSGYPYDACLNVAYGNITCEYPNSACSAGFFPVASIASSESGDNNLTNAHVADFNMYAMKVCCHIGGQGPPSVASATIAPVSPKTSTDLECQNGAVSDPDGDAVTLHYNWIRNGTSATVLNIPMDYDSTNDVTHDISGHGNHGTPSGSVSFLPAGGQVGGAFNFTGGFIDVGNDSALSITDNITIALWIKPMAYGTYYSTHPVVKWSGTAGANYVFYFFGNFTGNNQQGLSRWYANAGGAWQSVSGQYTFSSLGTWYHVVWEYNSVQGGQLYINGVAQGSRAGSGLLNTSIAHAQIEDGNFNGMIDEVMIFNRSLTAAEVLTLYNSNNKWLNNSELRRTEGWQCSITPIDSTGLNGSTVVSGIRAVGGSPPLAPNLTYPAHNNQTAFERFVRFNWTNSSLTERDGDTVTYQFNLSLASGACSVQTSQSNVAGTSYSFGELCTDQLYSWNVTACDVDGCSAPSTLSNFTIQSVAGLRLVVNQTQFGVFDRGQSKATDVNGITPFVVNNTGNVRINVTLAGNSSPFSTAALPTWNYTYKAGINTTNAFNISGSRTAYTPIDSAYQLLLKQLNYSSQAAGYAVNSTARIDMNITAPVDEPPGNKQANITVSAIRSSVTS